MRTSLFMLIMTVWIFGAILGSTFEEHDTTATWTGTDTTSEHLTISSLDYLLDLSNATQETDLGLVSLPLPNIEWLTTAFNAVTWRFSFITGDYQLFYYTVCAPFVMAGVLSFGLLFYGIIRGNITWG